MVLAGVNVTINDHRAVQPQDLGNQFFITEADLGSNVRPSAAESASDRRQPQTRVLAARRTLQCVT